MTKEEDTDSWNAECQDRMNRRSTLSKDQQLLLEAWDYAQFSDIPDVPKIVRDALFRVFEEWDKSVGNE